MPFAKARLPGIGAAAGSARAKGTDNKGAHQQDHVHHDLQRRRLPMASPVSPRTTPTTRPAMDAIAADTTYGSDFLGGQNHIALFKESAAKIDMKNACAYDQGCNEQMQNAMKDYFTGKTTSIADAMDAFKTALDAKYTGLTYDDSFNITSL
jgi:hypothetical protein